MTGCLSREQNIFTAIKTGPYGRCVYHCDNDQPDHYIANMVFQDGVTVSFSMEAFSPSGGRRTRIMGTKGYIDGDGVLRDLLEAVCWNDESRLTSTVAVSVESHVMGFDAEKSRKNGRKMKVRV